MRVSDVVPQTNAGIFNMTMLDHIIDHHLQSVFLDNVTCSVHSAQRLFCFTEGLIVFLLHVTF